MRLGGSSDSNMETQVCLQALCPNVRMKEKQEVTPNILFMLSPISLPCCSLPQVKAATFQYQFKTAPSSPYGFLTIVFIGVFLSLMVMEVDQAFCCFTMLRCYDK